MEYAAKLTGAAVAFSLQGKLSGSQIYIESVLRIRALPSKENLFLPLVYQVFGLMHFLTLKHDLVVVHLLSAGEHWSEAIERDVNAVAGSSAKLLSCPDIRIKLVEVITSKNGVHTIPKYAHGYACTVWLSLAPPQ